MYNETYYTIEPRPRWGTHVLLKIRRDGNKCNFISTKVAEGSLEFVRAMKDRADEALAKPWRGR